MPLARAAVVAVALLSAAVSAQEEGDRPPPRREAAQVARDGNFLPLTVSARIGEQRVSALVLAGGETTSGYGAIGSVLVEGALFGRLAIRAGVEYLSATGQYSPTVGFRVGVLTQEKQGIDLGVAVFYKKVGFTEATQGELEMMVTAARRFGRLGLFANFVYGQGFESAERDAEGRLAALVALGEHCNVGVDARARFDLGDETPARKRSPLEADFDLLAGPVATASIGPLTLLAQAGLRTVVRNDASPTPVSTTQNGFAAVGGVGAAF